MKIDGTQRSRSKHRLRQRTALGMLAMFLSLAMVLTIAPKANAMPMTALTVNLSNDPAGRTEPTSGTLGVNVLQFLPNFADPSVNGLLKTAGISVYRYPGGSNADYYHWADNSVDQTVSTNYYDPISSPLWPFNPYRDPTMDFDTFMNNMNAVPGSQADITINYGTGTIQEAKNWVQYANKNGTSPDNPNPGYVGPTYSKATTGHTYGIKYWEIGNEDYGDGTYGYPGNAANWEYVASGKQGPANYANAVVQYANAMKSVDGSIQVGAVFAMPSNFPADDSIDALALTNHYPAGAPLRWNRTLLQTAGFCNAVDFVAVHWYAQQPGQETDSALLSAPELGVLNNSDGIATMMSNLRSQLNFCASARGSKPPIAIRVTETNSVNSNPGSQTTTVVNQMFLEDTIATFLENGAQSVDWWSLHNGFYQPANDIPGNPDIDGVSTTNGSVNGVYTPVMHSKINVTNGSIFNGNMPYGDFGLLSVGPSKPIQNNTAGNGVYFKIFGGPASAQVDEPSADTPFPSYYGMEMMSNLIPSGASKISVLDASITQGAHIVVHAVLESRPFVPALLTIMVINEDPNSAPDTITLNLPAGLATIATYSGSTQTGGIMTTGTSASSFTASAISPGQVTSYTIATTYHETELVSFLV